MRTLAIVLLLASSACAQIKAPERVEAYKPLILESQNTAADVRIWSSEPPVEMVRVNEGQIVHVWAPPGKYRFKLVAITLAVDWEKKTKQLDYQEHYAVVEVGGSVPVPPPVPPPPPPGKRWVIIVEETSQRRAPWGDIFIAFRSSDLGDNRLLIVDKDTDVPALQPYLKLISPSAELPLAFVVDDSSGTGRVLYQGPAPKSVDELKKLIAEH